MWFVIDNEMQWGDTDEEPAHEVTLSAFLFDRYEVSATEFSRFLNVHPENAKRYLELGSAVTVERVDGKYQPRPGLGRHPINRVSWFGADAYCRWREKLHLL